MDQVEHCGNWVGKLGKRNLNLENFLRKLSTDAGFPRYYESCALERKGVLTLRQVVVTDTALIFTENVPKTVLLSIPLANIRGIEMVADRKALLNGGKMQQCICQHVQVHSVPTNNTSTASTKASSRSEEVSSRNGTTTNSGRISATSTTLTLVGSSLNPDSDSSFTDFSRQSSRMEGSVSLSPGLMQAYEPPVFPILPPLLLEQERRRRHEVTTGSTSSSSPFTTHLGGRPGRRSTTKASSQQSDTRKGNQPVWSESKSASDLDGGITTGRRRGGGEKAMSRSLFPSSRSPLNSWTGSSEEKVKERAPRRPRSLDMSQLSKLRHRMLGLVFGDDDDEEKERLSYKSPPPPPSLVISPVTDQGVVTVDFYLYRPNSVLLNELFLFWNRNRLTLLQEDMDIGEDHHRRYGLRVTEKVFSKLPHLLSNTANPTISSSRRNVLTFHDVLPKLGTLHRTLMKYEQLSRMLWKDWAMVMQLLKLLETYTFYSDMEEDEDVDYFVDRLSSITVLMDIFRLLLEATGPSWFLERTTNSNSNNNNFAYKNNNYISTKGEASSFTHQNEGERSPTTMHDITFTLTRVVFRSPLSILPPNATGRRKVVKEVVCNPRKFAEGQWLSGCDTKAIKAVSMVHNSSVALLHEILSTVHFSSKDKERAKFMSCLQSCSLESYLLLSMTQLLNLLWDNGVQLGASQTVMLFRHVSIAQTLMVSVPSTLEHLRYNFCEEFRYFVHEESANKKIPDRYPLKPTLLRMCEHLRQEIIDK
ncbi:uncharacterized protein LOC118438389 isoform X2 [Folsomia candida]|uniref:uncharacterized protein LOC118438389 isoform X2 n=1 Tax=Folsomia candida TaxID=158441 RepID=UPI001604A204|nr:uncharacterized protein LOC118438389 isoform X2 [Folsomia candida]